jgi:hypothetical protein
MCAPSFSHKDRFVKTDNEVGVSQGQIQQQPPVIVKKTFDRQQLRLIAQNQKNVIYCVLFNILASTTLAVIRPYVSLAASRPDPASRNVILEKPEFLIAFVAGAIVSLAFTALSIYATYQLALSMRVSKGWAVLLAISVFIPCISLFVLLAVTLQASTLLQQHGLKVGLMGADIKSI